ncbi:MAG: hypothetical protein GXP42_04105 [Chloroflexi bacterium]|nr:hypothetical protein [Chloroflexota bacterium]
MEPFTLIRTKLNRPRVVSDLTKRPRLVEQLNKRMGRKLTLVVAPAGYGKTTLVLEWLDKCKRPNAWLSLDEGDSDLAMFLNYFIAAVQTMFPQAIRSTYALLRAPELPPAQVLTGTLINDLDRIEQPFILVLDDYHFVRDMAVHDFIDKLLCHAPQTLHLVLISRLNPPLNLRQLRARGQMLEIRTDDLRFTIDETRTFAQKVYGKPLDEKKAAKLQAKTEGWATGLRLCFLSLKDIEELDAIAEKLPVQGLVTDYLFNEVFASQPKPIQEHLLRTSILDRFSAPLCEHLCDAETVSDPMGGQAFMAWLEQADVFVIALDERRRWFRYHHLFQDLLKRQLRRELGEAEIARLHRRASEWFAQNGLIDEAIRHALAAGDANRAIELIEDNKDHVLNADRWPILERWLSYLPERIIKTRPKLLLIRLWIAHFRHHISAIPPLLKQLDAQLEEDAASPTMLGEIAFFRGVPQLWRGELEQSIRHFERAAALIPSENKFARGATELHLATVYQMAGKADKAIAMQRALLNEEREDNARKGRLLGSLVFVYLLSGRVAEAYRFATRLQSMALRSRAPFFEGWAAYLLGHIHWGWSDLETAASHFTQAVEKRFLLDHHAPLDSHIGLALCYQGLGKTEQATEVMEDLLTYASITRNPLGLLLAHSAQARLAVLQGDVEKAAHIVRGIDFSAPARTMFLWMELPRVTQARVLVARESADAWQKGAALLEEQWRLARASHNVRQQIDILPVLAAAHQKLGRQGKALEALQEAVMLAEPGGWVRPFLEVGPVLMEPLRELRWRSAAQDFIDEILSAFPVSQSAYSSQTPPPLVEPLTDRELDVLALLARRYSNKEIAAQLFIAPATVKRHASNIYQKLGVKGRRQAVEKAIALGLLSPPE